MIEKIERELLSLAEQAETQREAQLLLHAKLSSMPDGKRLVAPITQAALVCYRVRPDDEPLPFEKWLLREVRRDVRGLIFDIEHFVGDAHSDGSIYDFEEYLIEGVETVFRSLPELKQTVT